MNVRYEDLDPNCHVNHARYPAYIEECRLALRRALNVELAPPETLDWATGALSICYLGSRLYQAAITAQMRSLHLGRTSFCLGYGVFDDLGSAVVASRRSDCLNRVSEKPVPLPARLAARLGRWQRPVEYRCDGRSLFLHTGQAQTGDIAVAVFGSANRRVVEGAADGKIRLYFPQPGAQPGGLLVAAEVAERCQENLVGG